MTSSDTLIRPSRSWLHFDLKELWAYRDLLGLLIHRDFVSKYKQTVLGPAWFIIQPLATTLVFTVVFGQIAQIPTDKLPPILFYLGGLLLWTYFSQTLNATSTIFTANAHLFGKVYFPRFVVPLATALTNLLALALQTATFFCFWIYYQYFTESGGLFSLSWTVLLLPLLIFHTMVLALGVGLWMSALTAKYRDLQHLMAFLIQLWLYATPIIYPLSQVPDFYRPFIMANPMTPIVEATKLTLLGSGSISLPGYGFSVLVTLVVFFSGYFVFHKLEKTFIDTV